MKHHTYKFPEDEQDKAARDKLWDEGRMSALQYSIQAIQIGQPSINVAAKAMEKCMLELRDKGADEQILELMAAQFMTVIEDRNRSIEAITRVYCGLEGKYVEHKH